MTDWGTWNNSLAENWVLERNKWPPGKKKITQQKEVRAQNKPITFIPSVINSENDQ